MDTSDQFRLKKPVVVDPSASMEASPGLDNGSMTTKVFLTPEPVRLLESHGQSLIALVPNFVINELQQDRDEQLQHVLQSVQQRGGQCLPTP